MPRTSTSFKNGKKAGGNRLGQHKKITTDLRQGIMDAAIMHGSDGKGTNGVTGYCFMLAKKYPQLFAPLLGRVLPLQIAGLTKDGAFIGNVRVVPVPTDHYIRAEEARALPPPPQRADDVIEGEVVNEVKSGEAA